MPAATINRLLERLSRDHADDTAGYIAALPQILAEFRAEREASEGPMTEQQWRGVLLSAKDLLDVHPLGRPEILDALDDIIRGRIGAAA